MNVYCQLIHSIYQKQIAFKTNKLCQISQKQPNNIYTKDIEGSSISGLPVIRSL